MHSTRTRSGGSNSLAAGWRRPVARCKQYWRAWERCQCRPLPASLTPVSDNSLPTIRSCNRGNLHSRCCDCGCSSPLSPRPRDPLLERKLPLFPGRSKRAPDRPAGPPRQRQESQAQRGVQHTHPTFIRMTSSAQRVRRRQGPASSRENHVFGEPPIHSRRRVKAHAGDRIAVAAIRTRSRACRRRRGAAQCAARLEVCASILSCRPSAETSQERLE